MRAQNKIVRYIRNVFYNNWANPHALNFLWHHFYGLDHEKLWWICYLDLLMIPAIFART